MSQIIDKVIVLFLKHKGRETQNIFRSVNTAVALTAAALTAEQACGEGLVFSCWRQLFMFWYVDGKGGPWVRDPDTMDA